MKPAKEILDEWPLDCDCTRCTLELINAVQLDARAEIDSIRSKAEERGDLWNAYVKLQAERDELKELHLMATALVIPGEVDTSEAYLKILRALRAEVNELKVKVMRQIGDIVFLTGERDAYREALKNILSNIALDWYVKQFRENEAPHGMGSGIVATIHNKGVEERAKVALMRARDVLARFEKRE